jgi:hypothetical protein
MLWLCQDKKSGIHFAPTIVGGFDFAEGKSKPPITQLNENIHNLAHCGLV